MSVVVKLYFLKESIQEGIQESILQIKTKYNTFINTPSYYSSPTPDPNPTFRKKKLTAYEEWKQNVKGKFVTIDVDHQLSPEDEQKRLEAIIKEKDMLMFKKELGALDNVEKYGRKYGANGSSSSKSIMFIGRDMDGKDELNGRIDRKLKNYKYQIGTNKNNNVNETTPLLNDHNNACDPETQKVLASLASVTTMTGSALEKMVDRGENLNSMKTQAQQLKSTGAIFKKTTKNVELEAWTDEIRQKSIVTTAKIWGYIWIALFSIVFFTGVWNFIARLNPLAPKTPPTVLFLPVTPPPTPPRLFRRSWKNNFF